MATTLLSSLPYRIGNTHLYNQQIATNSRVEVCLHDAIWLIQSNYVAMQTVFMQFLKPDDQLCTADLLISLKCSHSIEKGGTLMFRNHIGLTRFMLLCLIMETSSVVMRRPYILMTEHRSLFCQYGRANSVLPYDL